MAPLFTARADRILRGVLVLAVFLVVGTPLALMAWVRTPYVTNEGQDVQQPVTFDHRHHVADDGIDCRYCHDTVERGPQAGIPSTTVCMSCHGQVWNQSPQLDLVRRSYFEKTPIRWNRVHRLPDFVYFDHSVHVHAGVGCETCHGRVDRMPAVYQVAPLTMGWCLDCHRNPEPDLRPRDAVTVMGWVRGPHDAERIAPARHLTSCTTCHR